MRCNYYVMSHFEHGALDKATQHLVDPKGALKRTWYECPDCHRDVHVRKGEKRTAYFAHRPDRENPCTYYNRNPSTEQKHRNAQLKLKQFLERGKEIDIGRICPCGCGWRTNWGITCMPSNIVKSEHRFKFNDSNKSADIAVLNSNGDIICIFEIVHTHYTREVDRPEPWHEIRADEINAIPSDSATITLTCVRQVERVECINKREAERIEQEKQWKEERIREEREAKERDAHHARMIEQWNAKDKIRKEEERKRQDIRNKEMEEEMAEKRRIALENEQQRNEREKKERERKKALQQQFKTLFQKHSTGVSRCGNCSQLASWLSAELHVGRCRKCERRIDELVQAEMKSVLTQAPSPRQCPAATSIV
jgi:hypothetical protein